MGQLSVSIQDLQPLITTLVSVFFNLFQQLLNERQLGTTYFGFVLYYQDAGFVHQLHLKDKNKKHL